MARFRTEANMLYGVRVLPDSAMFKYAGTKKRVFT